MRVLLGGLLVFVFCVFFFFFNDTATTEIYTLSLHDALPIYLAREILASLPERLPRLPVELLGLLLHRGVLHFEPLLRGRDVGDAALHVLELPQLLLVRVVERLGRVFGAVEQLRELRLHDRRRAPHQAWHPSSWVWFSGPA